MLISSLFILVLYQQLGNAQITGDFPSCAVACIVANPLSSCANLDVACFCSDPSYVTSIQSCLSTSCTAQDYYTSAVELLQVCQSSGVSISISLPSAPTAKSTTSSGATVPPTILSDTPTYSSSIYSTPPITSNIPSSVTSPVSSSITSPISSAQIITSTSQAPLPPSTQPSQVTPSSTPAQEFTSSSSATLPVLSDSPSISSSPSITSTLSSKTSDTSNHPPSSLPLSSPTSAVVPSLVLATGGPQSSQQATNNSGLSTGAYIGIGVGVGIGALLVIGLVVLVFCIGKRKGRQEMVSPTLRSNTIHSELETDGQIQPTAEMPTGVTNIEYIPGMTDMRYGQGVADTGYGQTWKPVELQGDKTWHQHPHSY